MSIRNFDAIFSPRSIALVGASNEPGTVGRVLAENLLRGGFAGPVMTVNPHEFAIQSTLNFRSIDALPITPDLAVVATPAAAVPGVIGELARRGCRAAVVISAGLGIGKDGRDLKREMLEAARPHLMRIVGPNCIGVISPAKGINASFAHLTPRSGDIALVSQSGAIVTSVLDWADERGIGFSHVMSLGDMGDVDFGDMLDFLAGDRATRSILLYVENVTHAKKFMSAARIAARAKHVVVIKAGRSAEGARAAQSHTGALAGADAVYDAAFRRAGLLRVGQLDEMFEAAATLATRLRVVDDRLTILTNGGGAGVLAVDALDAEGGRLAALSDQAIARLDAVMPAAWSRGNPVDIIGDADGARYAAALEILGEEQDSDAILVINCPTAVASPMQGAQAVADATVQRPQLPILTTWLGGTAAAPARAFFASRKIATFDGPDKAIRAFMHLHRYRRNQEMLMETPAAGVVIGPADLEAARALVRQALASGRTVLTEPESKQLLSLFGIPIVQTLLAADPEEAGRRFQDVGGPAVLKIVSPAISHKSDVGGVRLNIRSAEEMVSAARTMLESIRQTLPEAPLEGFSVQPMVVRADAQELIAGIASDPTFGPVVLFGRGGKATEVIGDRAIGLPPLNSVLAREMIASTRISKLLAGFRDVPPVPLDRIVDVLIRLSELAVLLPEVAELDINPLLANAGGVIALDARVSVRAVSGAIVSPAIRPYPREFEQPIELADGTPLLLRPIRPEDEAALVAMVERCTPRDLRLRFMGQMRAFPHQTAARFSQIDYDREMALVAMGEPDEAGKLSILGVVRLVSDPENEAAEFAVLVRSDMKGRGLGYRLMTAILDYGRRRGLQRVYGEILRENATMLRMARELGFETEESDPQDDTVKVVVAFDTR
ncbi:MAG: bifunctional acetate--CoA ligase family protein/GNAT family N-acetyltransferase [Aurantimonas endophytica]|uniref:bifunctional acetate--CoA ligase family protein/GNAT family N-acetyltransferase n=1 Tax=Aurantimonas endophytica TaxID=1522175 RepID=UPI003002B223